MSSSFARLAWVDLGVCDVERSVRFYCDVLGMKEKAHADGFARVGYDGQDADVVLRQSDHPYVAGSCDRYWKIGITLPNVDLGAEWLRSMGVDVSPPRQFLDIGYMSHLSDPDGYVIELLQHDFEGNRPHHAGHSVAPLGGGATVGQITIRVADLEKALDQFERELGMKLLSIQAVTGYGFTLHFLAFTDETPAGEITDPAIREWLWKRPYTTLELQSFDDGRAIEAGVGYNGFAIAGLSGATETLVIK